MRPNLAILTGDGLGSERPFTDKGGSLKPVVVDPEGFAFGSRDR